MLGRRCCWVCVLGTMERSEMMLCWVCPLCGFRTDPDEDAWRVWWRQPPKLERQPRKKSWFTLRLG